MKKKLECHSVATVFCAITSIMEIFITGSFAADNFALMSGTLRTFQVHACDGEELRIQCPPETVISINLAQYGRISGQGGLCAPQKLDLHYIRKANITSCLAQRALNVIEALCRKQRICRLMTSPTTFREDPCPEIRKYAEVAYKCRPDQFINRVVCEGEQLVLKCTSPLKILIYSAAYGSTPGGVLECQRSKTTSDEVCESSYASEAVMSSCNGRHECAMTASSQTFGNPGCSSAVQKHLKVVFTCVPKEVLKHLVEDEVDRGMTRTTSEAIRVDTTSYPAWAGGMDYAIPSYMFPRSNSKFPTQRVNPTFKLEMQRDDVSVENANGSNLGDRKIVGFITEVASAHKFITGNKQKLILYVIVSLGIGLIIFSLVVVMHWYLVRSLPYRDKQEVSVNCEDEFFSDSDLDQIPPEDLPPPCITDTMLRKISDTIPRAPVAPGTSKIDYFS